MSSTFYHYNLHRHHAPNCPCCVYKLGRTQRKVLPAMTASACRLSTYAALDVNSRAAYFRFSTSSLSSTSLRVTWLHALPPACMRKLVRQVIRNETTDVL